MPVLDPAPVVPVVASRVRINVTQGGTTPATAFFIVERSDDGGLTYLTVLGAERVANTGGTIVVYDYEAPRDVPLTYRVRAIRTDTGADIYSTGALVGATLAFDGQTHLRSGTDPSYNIVPIHATRAFATTSSERQTVYETEGRSDPVINASVIRSEAMELELFFANDVGYAAFEALRRRQEPVLFQSCYGDDGKEQWWLRLGPDREQVSLTTDKMGTEQYRRVRLSARETKRPGGPFVLSAAATDPYGEY